MIKFIELNLVRIVKMVWFFYPITRAVYIDMFNKLSSCMFDCCPFYGLTCNKCHYCVS